ncbi:MAG: DUF5930 domain-containing protein, partial [Paracoccaceae bacterium]|nr:DUF5930 domain-containing protein [Paracoccaceae bacterium]
STALVSKLLAERRELETGMEVVQATLRNTMRAREEARRQLAALSGDGDNAPADVTGAEAAGTMGLLSAALAETAAERDQIASDAESAIEQAQDMQLELRLLQERNDQIFRQLEEAMLVSVEPLDEMFRA